MMSTLKQHQALAGFTLVEMAIVLLIVALLLGGLLPTITSQIDQQHRSETSKQMDEIQQALIGFAITNGRLPCPAINASSGVEDPSPPTGVCTQPYAGFVPAATLGIASITDNLGNKGFAVDSWGNRIRYAVTTANGNAFTTTNGMSTIGMSVLGPNLLVCSSSTAVPTPFSGMSCGSNNALTSGGVPVVIVSTGKNGAYGSPSADETANLDGAVNNITFVSHDLSPTFDDLIVWISPNILFNRMVAAGKLP